MARATESRDESPKAAPAPASPMGRAVVLAMEIRDLLLAAAKARGDSDATKDAGELAAALHALGGALADEQQPWTLMQALERNPSHADPDGTERLTQFIAAVVTAIKHGTRRKALGLGPQAGLALFARVAMKYGLQRTAREALDAAKRDQEIARQQADRVAHEQRGARATLPAIPAGGPPPPDDDDEPEADPFKV